MLLAMSGALATAWRCTSTEVQRCDRASGAFKCTRGQIQIIDVEFTSALKATPRFLETAALAGRFLHCAGGPQFCSPWTAFAKGEAVAFGRTDPAWAQISLTLSQEFQDRLVLSPSATAHVPLDRAQTAEFFFGRIFGEGALMAWGSCQRTAP